MENSDTVYKIEKMQVSLNNILKPKVVSKTSKQALQRSKRYGKPKRS